MTIRFTGLASGLDTDNMIQQMIRIERMKVDRVIKQKTKLEWQQDIWQDMNKKLYDFYRKPLFDLRSASNFNKKSVISSNTGVASVTGNASAVNGMHTLEVERMAKASYLTGAKMQKITIGEQDVKITSQTKLSDVVDSVEGSIIQISSTTNGEPKTINIDENETVGSLINKIRVNDSNINMNFDTNFDRIFMSTKGTGEKMRIEVTAVGDKSELGNELLEKLGLIGLETINEAGVNAEVKYNGAILTSDTNNFAVNGLTINVLSEGTTNLSVSQDTDAIYKSVKDFILAYNELVMDINGKINADTARGYEPLTSEEKKAMSEDEIKKWEDTIKNSLLRRDGVLTGLSQTMRSILVTSDGVSLENDAAFKFISQIGIVTGDYSERGILHIEGDSDFGLHGDMENKLRKAIEEDSEGVSKLLNALANKLYGTMQDRMKSTQLSSALTFYDDKQMRNKVREFDTEIARLEQRLIDVEERYYRQFAAMEKAMQEANSTMSWLMQQLGGGM
ncbi:flagellar hook-associated protein 2 [Natranaerovirga pectinivora]|uniref:Flagellar hook-associated protein 2 n=1 Tax=Natranaerovirga pectinivora TaxID=682400 RepID=A0A4R3MKD3_9FIRM|nr:flagellar filament capping protein FliD [Natranaerovirga pectinivora]TCT14046.1 flagellar hook-associated protein 2 [Natranaerovirga pectinivora]